MRSMPIQALPLLAAAAMLRLSADPVSAQDTSFGQRLFQDKADCQFCHGIDGDGRGDPRSQGQAVDLHKTILNREQLIEVITCGRPGTEMPHFDRFAYEDKSCYGRTAAELRNDTPHDPHSTSLAKREIEAVVDYIFANLSANRTPTVRQAQLTAQLDKETIPWTEISLYHQVIFTPV
jgi:mono/diheme cytochrome c family protein